MKFYKLPENVSNILGRQLKMIGRPEINFEAEVQRYRGNTYKEKMNATFEPISASFSDDENGVTSTLLYAQVMRQLNKYPDVFGNMDAVNQRDYKFDIEIDYYNASGEKTDTVVLVNCFISSISHGDNMYSDDTEKEITVTFEFDNLDMPMFDEVEGALKKGAY